MHREPKPNRALLSAPSSSSPPSSPPLLLSPVAASTPSSSSSSSSSRRFFKRFRSLLPSTSYRAVLNSICMMAVLFWVLHLFIFSLILPDYSTSHPTTSSSEKPSSPQAEPSVADLALSKIFRDSRQILGVFPASFNKSAAAKRRAQWMTPLPDSLPLTHIRAIPGTHDSATWNFTTETRNAIPSNPSYLPAEWFRCQTKSIVESLEAGVRFFDLRYAALDPGNGANGKKDEEGGVRLVFWHKMALLSEVATVEDVLFGFYGWLEQRGRGETVMVSLQYEHPTRSKASNTPQVQRALHSILTTPAARRFIYPSHSLPPTLGDARGKIILFKRFDLPDLSLDQQLSVPGLNFSPTLWPENNKNFELVYNQLSLGKGEGTQNETAYIEDYFEPNDLPNKMNGSVEENIAAKWSAVEEHLRAAADASARQEGEDDGLWITFTSGEHVFNEPNITPEIMALGPEEQWRDGTKKANGGTVKGGVNEKLLRLLKDEGANGLKGKRLGVVVMDFWEMEGEGDLIGELLGLNGY